MFDKNVRRALKNASLSGNQSALKRETKFENLPCYMFVYTSWGH